MITYKELRKEDWPKHFTEMLNMWMIYYPPYFDGDRKEAGLYLNYALQLKSTKIVCAWDDDKMIGVVAGQKISEDTAEDRNIPKWINDNGWTTDEFMTMKFLINDLSYRHQGINLKMCQYWTELVVKGHRGVAVDVADIENKPVTFFERMGYVVLDEVPKREHRTCNFLSVCYWNKDYATEASS